MKTVEEFIKEIDSSEALQNELKTLENEESLSEFLKKNDVDGTAEDFGKAVMARSEAEGKLDDVVVEAVAGGSYWADKGFKSLKEYEDHWGET